MRNRILTVFSLTLIVSFSYFSFSDWYFAQADVVQSQIAPPHPRFGKKAMVGIQCSVGKEMSTFIKSRNFKILFHFQASDDITKLILANRRSELVVVNLLENGKKMCIVDTFGATTTYPGFINLDLLYGGSKDAY